jgi:outer membrane biosynthesis protein TonB
MTRARGFVLLAALGAGLLLAGCENFDPTEMFDLESVFGSKKRLAGDRKPVFPEGTPGVPQGVPPELVRGAQQTAQPETAQSVPQQAAVQEHEAEPKPEPKAKAKPKPKAKEAKATAKPAESTTASAAPRAAETPPASPEQAAGAWPAKPQPSMQVEWPEPPTYSARTRPQ